jgi:hypothetical protein
VRKHEEWTEEELTHYIEKHKEHEARRASTNERQAYWENYFKNKQKHDPETGFDMNKY